MERPIRIVLADDHPVVRIGVRNMLTEDEGFEVVGEAGDGDEAITGTLELQPDILLLDLLMRGGHCVQIENRLLLRGLELVLHLLVVRAHRLMTLLHGVERSLPLLFLIRVQL